jgi:hypothetical protein
VEAVGTRLNLQPETVNPMKRLQVGDGVFENQDVDEVAPLMLLAIGLALRT